MGSTGSVTAAAVPPPAVATGRARPRAIRTSCARGGDRCRAAPCEESRDDAEHGLFFRSVGWDDSAVPRNTLTTRCRGDTAAQYEVRGRVCRPCGVCSRVPADRSIARWHEGPTLAGSGGQGGRSMTVKAWVYEDYGSPDMLRFKEVEIPTPAGDDVAVRVQASELIASPRSPRSVRTASHGCRPIALSRRTRPLARRRGRDRLHRRDVRSRPDLRRRREQGGPHSVRALRRTLAPKRTLAAVGGSQHAGLFGPGGVAMRGKLVSPFVSQRIVPAEGNGNEADLVTLASMIKGKRCGAGDRTCLPTRGGSRRAPICRGRPPEGKGRRDGRRRAIRRG